MRMDDAADFATAVVDLAKHRRRRADAGLRLNLAMIPVWVAAAITMSAVGAGITLFWAFVAFGKAHDHAADFALWSRHPTVVAALEHALLDPPVQPEEATWLVELPDRFGNYRIINDLGSCSCDGCSRALIDGQYTVIKASG